MQLFRKTMKWPQMGLVWKLSPVIFIHSFIKPQQWSARLWGVSCILNLNFDSWGCCFDWRMEIMVRSATCVFWKGLLYSDAKEIDASFCSDGSDGVLEVINHLLEILIVFTKVERMKTNQSLDLMFGNFPFYEIFQHWCGFCDAPRKLVWSSRSIVICKRGHWQLPG